MDVRGWGLRVFTPLKIKKNIILHSRVLKPLKPVHDILNIRIWPYVEGKPIGSRKTLLFVVQQFGIHLLSYVIRIIKG